MCETSRKTRIVSKFFKEAIFEETFDCGRTLVNLAATTGVIAGSVGAALPARPAVDFLALLIVTQVRRWKGGTRPLGSRD